jgi:gliding motility-associated-like protein
MELKPDMYFLHYTVDKRLITIFENITSGLLSTFKSLNERVLRKLLLITGCWLLVGGSTLFSQVLNDYRSNSAGPASWSVAGSWQRFDGSSWVTADLPPTSVNNVTVRSGHIIVMDIGSYACNNLTIELTGALNGTQPIVINGNLVVNGTFTTTNTIDLFGSSIDGSGTITILDILIYFQVNGNINIPSSSSIVLEGEIHFMKNDLTITNNGIITISRNITENGFTGSQWINASNSDLYIGGNITPGVALTASAPGNTVNYYSAIDQIISTTTYNILNVIGAGNKLLSGDITVTGDLNITGNGSILDCGRYQITGNPTGNLQMTSTMKLGNVGMAIPVLFPTNFIKDNIKLDANSTVIYQSNGDQIISSVPEYGNLTTASSGTKTIDGSIVAKGNIQIGTGTVLDVSTSDHNISLQGNWSNQGSFLARNATVTFNGTSSDAQYISNITGDFFNLSINNTSGVALSSDVRISNLLNMASGNISAGFNILNLIPSFSGSLNHIAGTIIGKFRRGISAGSDYLFPVGTAAFYRPATFNFSNLGSALSITAEFLESSPGSFSSYSDNGVLLVNLFQGGYWHFSSSGTPANTYSLSLTGNGFTGFVIDNNARITGRNAASNNWQAFGTHGNVINPTITRTAVSNLNTTSFDYTFANSSCSELTAVITPGNNSICSGTSPGIFTATGSGGDGTYTYLWYKDGVSIGIKTQTYDPGLLMATSTFYCAITSGSCGTVNSAVTTITVTGDLTAGISPGNISICYNTSPGIFTATGGGGNGTFTYLWYENGLSTGVTTQTYDPGPLTMTSTFYCAITVGTCTVFTSMSIVTVAELSAAISPGNTLICSDNSPGTFTATGSGGNGTYTYLWYKDGISTGVTTQTYDPGILTVTTSIYCAITSGSCGTINTDIITITVSGDLTGAISPGNTTICYNTSPGIFTATGGGGTGPYTYLWYKNGTSTGITTQNYDPGLLTALTTLYCTITSGTCSVNTSTITITVNGNLTAGISPGNTTICSNSSPGIFTATGSGGTGTYSYLWYKDGISTGITTQNWDPGNLTTSAAIYCAITSETCGTVNTNIIAITVSDLLTAGISPGNTSICYNTSPGIFTATGTGGTGTYTYLWFRDGLSTGIATQTYNPGILTATTAIYCTITSGSCGMVNTSTTTITVSPPLIGPVLNVKIPDLNTVCSGQALSATFTAGSGGEGCTDAFQYSFDNSGNWISYTPGVNISTIGHSLVEIQGQRSGCSGGAGCAGTPWVTLASWIVNPQPSGPSLSTKTPDLATVCDGLDVSAAFNSGAGGVGCTDIFQYRYDNAGAWTAYIPGANISSAGHTLIEIQGQRTGCTTEAGCTGTEWVTLASWNIIPPPVGPSLNIQTPDIPAICSGQIVSATFNPGSGGAGCTDAFQYRFDNTGIWTIYTPGSIISTTGHTHVEIQGQRAGCTTGAGCTGTPWVTLSSWNINSQPVGPSLNTKTPDLPIVCDGQVVSATFITGSGGVGCTDAFQYRYDNTGTWTTYVPGDNISTTGHTLIEIQGQRTGCSAQGGCTGTAWATLAAWNVNPQPVGTTLNTKVPNMPTVCSGQDVSATFNSGSGGIGCTDSFQYRFDNTGVWTAYTPGAGISTTGHTLVEIQGQRSGCISGGEGCYGTAWVTLVSWNINPQPSGPALNNKIPNLVNVCSGQDVSATFNSGSGGVGCTDSFQFRFDNTGAWNSYTPGNNISTTGHTSVDIQGQRGGCTTGAGCAGTSWVTLASWNINPQPTGPALDIKIPNLTTVCSGQDVKATFSAGSGGVGCTDAFQYRYDNTGIWATYVPGNNISTLGHTLLEIQGQRAGCIAGAGCNGTVWVTLVSWNINPQPVGPALNNKFPNLATVCSGQDVSATFNPGSSGVGCADAFQYRFDNSGIWTTYTPGNIIATSGHTSVDIQGQRTGCTAGTGCSGTAWETLASWNINPQPVSPVLNIKTPNLDAVCDRQDVSATFSPGSGGVGCTDAFQYRLDGSGSWAAYTPGADISTTGHTLVEIRGQRTGCTSGAGCVGTEWVTLASWTVNPLPEGVSDPSTQTICSNLQITTIDLSTSNSLTGTMYEWTRDNNINVTGIATSGSGNIGGSLRNLTGINQTVIFTIIPTSADGCTGDSFQSSVVVQSEPVGVASSVSQITCSNVAITPILLSTSNGMNSVTTWNWTRDNNINVTGIPPDGIGNISGTLNNITDIYQDVRYTVIPASNNGCAGDPVIANVTVNPVPRVIPVNANLKPDTSICFGGITSTRLTSPTVLTSGEVRLDFTVTAPGSITGNITPGLDLIPGYAINRSYQNNSDIIQSVYFNITPRVNNAVCGPGNTVISQVKVHPQTIQYNLPLAETDLNGIEIIKPFTCGGGSNASLKVYTSTDAGPYNFAWTRQTNDTIKIYNNPEITIQYSGRWDVIVTDNLGCKNFSSQWIQAAAQFYSSLYAVTDPVNGYGITCPGSNDGVISVKEGTSTQGVPPFEYWIVRDDQDTTSAGVIHGILPAVEVWQTWNGLSPGIYRLILKDSEGCYNTDPPQADILEPDTISVVFDADLHSGGYNVSCKGYNDSHAWINTIRGGNGGYTYQWFYDSALTNPIPGMTNDFITGLVAGKYYLRVTDRKGCRKTVSITITEPTGIVLTGSELSQNPVGNNNISCNGGNDGFINMTITGGSGSYSYSWVGPNGFAASTRDISGLKAGVYTCTVQDVFGCKLVPSPTFTLTQPAPLSVSIDQSLNIGCYGSATGSIKTIVTGGSIAGYTYTWSTTNGSGLIPGQKDQNALTAGTYKLAVKDLNNCENSISVDLTQPDSLGLLLSGTNITCQSQGSVNLTVTGGIREYNYLWAGPNGFSAITEDISNLVPGNYSVTVTDANSCVKTSSIVIYSPALLTYDKILSDNKGYNISCYGLADGYIQISPTSGEAPFLYKWSGPNGFTASTKDISGLKAGDYTLELTDNNLCTVVEIIKLSEPGKLSMTFNLSSSISGGYSINCAGEKTGSIDVVPLNPVGTVNYLWSDKNPSKTRTNLSAGIYSLIITDGNKCTADSSISLTQPEPLKIVFDISKPPTCPDKPDGELRTVVTGGVKGADYFYLWSDNSTGSSLTNIPEGLFKVRVTDLNSCSIADSVVVNAMSRTCLIIPNAITPNQDGINDVWNIGLTELYPDLEIKIFNRWGEIVWKSEKGYPRPWDGTSNGSPLPIDSYHYIIDLHNGSRLIIGNVTILR